jgi:hypothetical protein
VIAEADRRRSAIMIALDVALALRPLRPLVRGAALLVVATLVGTGLARPAMLGAGLLRPGLLLSIALARGILALRAMLARLLTGLEALDARGTHGLGMRLAVLAWPTMPVGTVRRTVAA